MNGHWHSCLAKAFWDRFPGDSNFIPREDPFQDPYTGCDSGPADCEPGAGGLEVAHDDSGESDNEVNNNSLPAQMATSIDTEQPVRAQVSTHVAPSADIQVESQRPEVCICFQIVSYICSLLTVVTLEASDSFTDKEITFGSI